MTNKSKTRLNHTGRRIKFLNPTITTSFKHEPPERKVKIARKERNRAYRNREGYIDELAGIYGYRCLCCGSRWNITLDHVRPVTLGGKTELENLQLLCQDCNERKANRIIDYRGMLP